VKLSVKSDYAARAVLGLARHFPTDTPLPVEELAAGQLLPSKYLVQILLELKGEGLVRSARGKDGGYLLARPPSTITLGDIIRAVDGKVFEAPALDDPACPPELQRAWQALRHAIETAAEQVTFQQLLDEDQAREKMWYI
jgi:Rrf2 family protein